MKIAIATQNPGKLAEFQAIFWPQGVTCVLAPKSFTVEETGLTFAENAHLKAAALAKVLDMVALADDSGLCVDALGGAPGIYSARYSGEGGSDRDARNREKLLQVMQKVSSPGRAAHFMCALSLVAPDGRERVSCGTLSGHIASAERGTQGFGYDAVFVPDKDSRTLAEMPDAERYRLSHRQAALTALKWQDLLGD